MGCGNGPLDSRFRPALDWLDTHLYTPDRVGLCWGDARMSNVLYRPDLSVAAALDWEISYLGDPAADLAWLFLTDWVSSPLPQRAPAPGTPSRAETLDRYQRRTGHKIGDMRFSDISAALLLAVPLIRLNTKLALPDVDLGAIRAERIEFILDGD
ncbi:MAG: phosphotransferase [Mycobacterium sp.]|uniref:phosphotransferase n=1 Tax=Mycobacterium sp. TaxID=1785 RepID=UPI003F9C58E9